MLLTGYYFFKIDQNTFSQLNFRMFLQIYLTLKCWEGRESVSL